MALTSNDAKIALERLEDSLTEKAGSDRTAAFYIFYKRFRLDPADGVRFYKIGNFCHPAIQKALPAKIRIKGK